MQGQWEMSWTLWELFRRWDRDVTSRCEGVVPEACDESRIELLSSVEGCQGSQDIQERGGL